MLIQSGSVFQILLGRDTGWNPQRRDDGSIPWSDIVRRHRWHMALGLVTGVAAFAIATSLFLWMSPTILGLVLAIPISWASGQLGLGLALRRLGLLMTPEERDPPAIAVQAFLLCLLLLGLTAFSFILLDGLPCSSSSLIMTCKIAVVRNAAVVNESLGTGEVVSSTV